MKRNQQYLALHYKSVLLYLFLGKLRWWRLYTCILYCPSTTDSLPFFSVRLRLIVFLLFAQDKETSYLMTLKRLRLLMTNILGLRILLLCREVFFRTNYNILAIFVKWNYFDLYNFYMLYMAVFLCCQGWPVW